jgi:hypothetical protein
LRDILTKTESCHGLAGLATRLLLLVSREQLQNCLAHGPLGDERKRVHVAGHQ